MIYGNMHIHEYPIHGIYHNHWLRGTWYVWLPNMQKYLCRDLILRPALFTNDGIKRAESGVFKSMKEAQLYVRLYNKRQKGSAKAVDSSRDPGQIDDGNRGYCP